MKPIYILIISILTICNSSSYASEDSILPSNLGTMIAGHEELADGSTAIYLDNGLTLNYPGLDLFAQDIGWKNGDRILFYNNVYANYYLANLSYQGAVPVTIMPSPEALVEAIDYIEGGKKIVLSDGSLWTINQGRFAGTGAVKKWKVGDRILIFPGLSKTVFTLVNLSYEVPSSSDPVRSVEATTESPLVTKIQASLGEDVNFRPAPFQNLVVTSVKTRQDKSKIALSNGLVVSLSGMPISNWKVNDTILLRALVNRQTFSSIPLSLQNSRTGESYNFRQLNHWKLFCPSCLELEDAPRVAAINSNILILDNGHQLQILLDPGADHKKWKVGDRVIFFPVALQYRYEELIIFPEGGRHFGLIVNFERQGTKIFGRNDLVYGAIIY